MTTGKIGRLIGGVIFVLLAGCGIQETTEKTLGAVEVSNETQKQLLEHTQELKRITELMQGMMASVEHGIHLQTLSTSLEKLLSPEATAILNPPLRMMPFASTFAGEATEHELIQTVHTLFTEAQVAPPEHELTRRVSLVAMSALSAFASLEKTRGIFLSHIEEHGRFEETALAMGAARFAFIRDYLLGSILENAKVLNVGLLREASTQFVSLRHLVDVPYAARLELSIPALAVEMKVSATEMQTLGRKAKRRFTKELPPEVLALPTVKEWMAVFEM